MKHLSVVGVLLLAFALRVIGIDFAQPNPVYNQSLSPQVNAQIPVHPDEYFYVSIPLEMHMDGRTNPNFFENPSFLINLNYVTYALTGAPIPDDADDLNRRQYAPFPLYVIGRLYSALGGLLAVAAAYAIGKHLQGEGAGIIAALLVTWSFPLVQHAHYATTSSLATGFVIVSFWGCIVAWRRANRRLFWLAGITAGLALGNRYNVAPVGFVLAVTGLALLWRQRTRPMLITVMGGGVLSLVTFVVTSPYVLLDFDEFWRQFSYIYGSYKASTPLPEPALWIAYRYIVIIGLGGLASMLSVVGVWRLWQQHRMTLILLVTFLLPYTLVVLNNNRIYNSDQLTLPVIVLLAVVAGVGCAALYRWNRYVGWGAAMLSLLVPVLLTGQLVQRFTLLETRYLAQEWVYEHIPQGSEILLIGGYNVPLDAADYEARQEFIVSRADEALPAPYIIVSDAVLFEQQRRYGNNTVAAYLGEHDFGNLVHIVERQPAWFADLPLNNATYWHHPRLYIYCTTEAACTAVK